jgi:hypothetical protein
VNFSRFNSQIIPLLAVVGLLLLIIALVYVMFKFLDDEATYRKNGSPTSAQNSLSSG